MLINTWSIGLLVCSAAALFMACGVMPTAYRVLRFWDVQADTEYQIQLEQQTRLSALLIQYLLFFQIISLLLLVLAADSFSQILVGAMCATGAFLANPYGLPSLFLKISGVFFCGFWIVLHRLDQCSEYSPLVRLKFFYFLAIIPFLLADSYNLFFYLKELEPEVITSCCGVIFSSSTSDGKNLVGPLAGNKLLYCFYGGAGILALGTITMLKLKDSHQKIFRYMIGVVMSFGWLLFFLLALLSITTVISSYIYAMPSHRCPFDILHREYDAIGYPIYFLLFGAVFCGASASLFELLRNKKGLQRAVAHYQEVACKLSLAMLCIFLLIVSYFPLIYHFGAGER